MEGTHFRGSHPYEQLMDRLEVLEKDCRREEKEAARRLEKLDQEMVELEKRIQQAETDQKAFQKLRETKARLEALKGQSGDMAQKEERLKRGEHAAEIRAEYQQVNGVEKQLYALERQEKEEEEATGGKSLLFRNAAVSMKKGIFFWHIMISASPWRNWKKGRRQGLTDRSSWRRSCFATSRIIWNRRNGLQTGSMS